MRIGVIGTGAMGSGLARRLARAGHDVMLGSRDPERGRDLGAATGSRGGTYAEAVAHGEAIVLAIPWWSIDAVAPILGPVRGKIVIDCTNPVIDDHGSLQELRGISAGEEIARQLPGARVVKCFNHIVAEVIHLDGDAPEPRIVAFLCGDDEPAKQLVTDLVAKLGFEPVDVGDLQAARMLEPLAGLMLRLAHGGLVPPERALALVPGGDPPRG